MSFNLYQHQTDVIDLALANRDFAIYHGLGSGKTCSAIQIMRYRFLKEKRIMKTLILGPVAVVQNWSREISKFSKIPSEAVFALKGTGKKRENQLQQAIEQYGNCVVITNHESLVSDKIFSLLQKWQPEIIIMDECHQLKGLKSKRCKNLVQITDLSKHNIQLTGTPILNSLIDIYMQFRLLDRGDTFGRNFFTFRAKYFMDSNSRWAGRPGYFPKWEVIDSKLPEVTEKIFKIAHKVETKDCIDLPERVVIDEKVDMSPEQAKIYKAMKDNFIATIKDVENSEGKDKVIVAQLAMVKALRLMQITSGILATDQGEIVMDNFPKLSRIEEILEELGGQKVILWCSFKGNYKQLSKLCEKLNLKYVMLTGEQTASQKQESMDSFCTDPSVNVIIANRRAGGTGVNLKEAAYSIVFSRNYSLAEELQSDARNYRSGSAELHKKIVKINMITENTIDEKVVEVLKGKQDLADKILDIAKII